MDDVRNLNRARQILDNLLPLVDEAERKFKSARNWGVIDILGGGNFVGLIKHLKLNSAKDLMVQINNLVQQLQNELSSYKNSTNYNMKDNFICTFADFVWDGFISDVWMQSKIDSSLNQIRKLKDQLMRLKMELN